MDEDDDSVCRSLDDLVEEIEKVLRHESSQTRLDLIREAIARELKRRRRGKD